MILTGSDCPIMVYANPEAVAIIRKLYIPSSGKKQILLSDIFYVFCIFIFFLNRILEMGNDPDLLKLYHSVQDMILEVINIFFYGILPEQNKK